MIGFYDSHRWRISKICVFFCFRNSVRLAIRKIMYAPSKQGEQPSIEVSKEFVMSPNKLHLEASLDKEVGTRADTNFALV